MGFNRDHHEPEWRGNGVPGDMRPGSSHEDRNPPRVWFCWDPQALPSHVSFQVPCWRTLKSYIWLHGHHGRLWNSLTYRIPVPILTQTSWVTVFEERNQFDQKFEFFTYLMGDSDTVQSLGTKVQRTPCFVSSMSWLPPLVLAAGWVNRIVRAHAQGQLRDRGTLC